MNRALCAAVAALTLVCGTRCVAATLSQHDVYIRDCLVAAGNAYHEPAAILVILLNVEGGRLGSVSQNTNGTADIGAMQVNDTWLPKLAAHWSTTPSAAYTALRDNFCANVEAGAWILRQGLDEAGGDFWTGVGYYHSHDPAYRRGYLRAVLQQALRLAALSQSSKRDGAAAPTPPQAEQRLAERERASTATPREAK
jgi:hypothetical protein